MTACKYLLGVTLIALKCIFLNASYRRSVFSYKLNYAFNSSLNVSMANILWTLYRM